MEIKWIIVEIRAATATGGCLADVYVERYTHTHTHAPLVSSLTAEPVGRAMERTWLVGAAVWWRRRALALFNVCAAQIKRMEFTVQSARSASLSVQCVHCTNGPSITFPLFIACFECYCLFLLPTQSWRRLGCVWACVWRWRAKCL